MTIASSLPDLTGFPPLVGESPRYLILGSMPGVKSLDEQQYYAHPRNSFWPIMAALYGFDSALQYDERCQILKQYPVAIWDVLKSCQRNGSLDSAIERQSMVPNDFAGFFAIYPTIRHIFFNGGKAATTYNKFAGHIAANDFTYTQLPSTSPAYAAMSFDEKKTIWHQALSSFIN